MGSTVARSGHIRWLVVVVMVAACESSTSGDGGKPGGQPGQACSSMVHNEGCHAGASVRCDPGTSKWVSLGSCPSGSTCEVEPDPSAAVASHKLSKCANATSGGTVTVSCGDGTCNGDETTAGCEKDCPLKAGWGCNYSSDHKYFEGIIEAVDPAKAWKVVYQFVLTCAFKGSCMKTGTPAGQQSCIAKCVRSKIAISSACSTCFGAHAGWCATQQCASQCSNTSSSSCMGCLEVKCSKLLGKCMAGGSTAPKPKCGNSKCEAPNETVASCSKDCHKSGCGNGKCDPGESSTCPSDCKSPSGSCAGKCGKFQSGATCQCDAKCAEYKDCCPDKVKRCGS